MASALESRAKEAFMDDDFELAADLYSQAISASPPDAAAAATLYADRAQAYVKLGSFTDAVADANKAIQLDPSMAKAYLRKGAACIKLEEYETAKAALEIGSSLALDDTRFSRLLKECNDLIADEKSNGVETVPKPTPSVSDPVVETRKASSLTDMGSLEKAPPIMEVPIKPKYRHEFYNTQSDVVVTVFAKKVPEEHVTIDFGEQILSISIEIPGEEAYHFQPRLFGKIVPEKCKYQVLSTKVEVRLAKADLITWTSLEYDKARSVPQKTNAAPAVTAQRPSYPSSRSKIDWDKLEAEMKKEEKDEKLEGDAAVNRLFQSIYRDADEDMRRAMMKSFVESNGTVLSTNWEEVGAKKIEESPPDGMELKKWEY